VALYWIVQFLLAVEEFLVASCVTIWYLHEQKYPGSELGESFKRLFRYHLGSIALGSLIVALIQIFRAVMDYIRYRAVGEDGETNGCLEYTFKCIDCICCCFEKCVKYINKNAYIEIAIWGDSFCGSACKALNTMSSNLLFLATFNGMGYLICMIIKLTVAGACAFVGYLAFEEVEANEVASSAVVVIFIALFSYVIADAFTDVYDTAADAMLLLFLEDLKANKTAAAMYAPKDLIKNWFGLVDGAQKGAAAKGGGGGGDGATEDSSGSQTVSGSGSSTTNVAISGNAADSATVSVESTST